MTIQIVRRGNNREGKVRLIELKLNRLSTKRLKNNYNSLSIRRWYSKRNHSLEDVVFKILTTKFSKLASKNIRDNFLRPFYCECWHFWQLKGQLSVLMQGRLRILVVTVCFIYLNISALSKIKDVSGNKTLFILTRTGIFSIRYWIK